MSDDCVPGGVELVLGVAAGSDRRDVGVLPRHRNRFESFQAGVQDISCTSGNGAAGSQSIPVQLETPSDVTSQVGGDKAVQVHLTSSQFQAVVVAVTKDNAIATFQYQTTPDADTTKLPNPTQLAALGIQEIAHTLG